MTGKSLAVAFAALALCVVSYAQRPSVAYRVMLHATITHHAESATVKAAAAHRKLPFKVTISAPETLLRVGQVLVLHVTITNTSDRTLGFGRYPGVAPDDGGRYRIEVRDARGRTPPPSAYAHSMRHSQRRRPPPFIQSSTVTVNLKPGQSFADWVSVTRFYDLGRPGKYTIWPLRPVRPWQRAGGSFVRSNKVTVTVAK